MTTAMDAIVREHNRLADLIGKKFALGDSLFERQLQKIPLPELVKLKDVVVSQIDVTPSKTSAAGVDDVEQQVEALAQSASVKTIQILEALAIRLGYSPEANREAQDHPVQRFPSGESVPYCRNALILQKSQADVYRLAKPQSSDQDLICQHCFLEISDFQTSASHYTVKDWSLLTSCHVLACPSLKDRRAAYRCFACHAHGRHEVEPSAAAFQKHLQSCSLMASWNKKQKFKGETSHIAKRTNLDSAADSIHSTPTPVRKPLTPFLEDRHSPSSEPAKPRSGWTDNSYKPTVSVQQPIPMPIRAPPPMPSPVSAQSSKPLTQPLRKPIPSGTASRTEPSDSAGSNWKSTSLPGGFPSNESMAISSKHQQVRESYQQPVLPPNVAPESNGRTAAEARVTTPSHVSPIRGKPETSPTHQYRLSTPETPAMPHLPRSARSTNGAVDEAEAANLQRLEELGITPDDALVFLRMAGGNANEAALLAWSNRDAEGPIHDHQQSSVSDKEQRHSHSRRWLGPLGSR